jgi:hypothetical protein
LQPRDSALLLTDAAPMLTRTGALAAPASTHSNKLMIVERQQAALIIETTEHA